MRQDLTIKFGRPITRDEIRLMRRVGDLYGMGFEDHLSILAFADFTDIREAYGKDPNEVHKSILELTQVPCTLNANTRDMLDEVACYLSMELNDWEAAHFYSNAIEVHCLTYSFDGKPENEVSEYHIIEYPYLTVWEDITGLDFEAEA